MFSAITTTIEAVVFNSLAGTLPRSYPTAVGEALLSACTVMLVYTWIVLVAEKVLALGGEPPQTAPPPPPRLPPTVRVHLSAPTVHVQPSSSAKRLPLQGENSSSSKNSGSRGDGFRGQAAGGPGSSAVVPTEGLGGG